MRKSATFAYFYCTCWLCMEASRTFSSLSSGSVIDKSTVYNMDLQTSLKPSTSTSQSETSSALPLSSSTPFTDYTIPTSSVTGTSTNNVIVMDVANCCTDTFCSTTYQPLCFCVTSSLSQDFLPYVDSNTAMTCNCSATKCDMCWCPEKNLAYVTDCNQPRTTTSVPDSPSTTTTANAASANNPTTALQVLGQLMEHQVDTSCNTQQLLDTLKNIVGNLDSDSLAAVMDSNLAKSMLDRFGTLAEQVLSTQVSELETVQAAGNVANLIQIAESFMATTSTAILNSPNDINDSIKSSSNGLDLLIQPATARNDVKIQESQFAANFSWNSPADVAVSLAHYIDTADVDLDNSTTISSNLISLSLYGAAENFVVTFRLPLSKPLNKSQHVSCTFWTPSSGLITDRQSWNSAGCIREQFTDKDVTCRCNHTTTFAVLVQTIYYQDSPQINLSLSILVSIGCSLSVCSLIGLFILFYILNIQSERTKTYRQLAAALMFAQTALLLAINVETQTNACKTFAILTQYFYQVTFSLALVQSIELLQHLHSKLRSERLTTMKMFLLAWGLPVVIAIASIAVGLDKYGTDSACWLSTKGGFVWAFAAPVLLLIFCTLSILIYVTGKLLFVAQYLRAALNNENPIWTALKSALVLTPVLGVSWIFGYFSLSADTVVFDYLFAIAIGFQGVFMLCYHLFINAEVKAALKRRSLAKQRMKSKAASRVAPAIVITDTDGHVRSMRSSVSDLTRQRDWQEESNTDAEIEQSFGQILHQDFACSEGSQTFSERAGMDTYLQRTATTSLPESTAQATKVKSATDCSSSVSLRSAIVINVSPLSVQSRSEKASFGFDIRQSLPEKCGAAEQPERSVAATASMHSLLRGLIDQRNPFNSSVTESRDSTAPSANRSDYTMYDLTYSAATPSAICIAEKVEFDNATAKSSQAWSKENLKGAESPKVAPKRKIASPLAGAKKEKIENTDRHFVVRWQ